MHNGVRLNKVIDLLEKREVVFGRVAMNGNLDELMYWNESDYDFVLIEMEHEGFNFHEAPPIAVADVKPASDR